VHGSEAIQEPTSGSGDHHHVPRGLGRHHRRALLWAVLRSRSTSVRQAAYH